MVVQAAIPPHVEWVQSSARMLAVQDRHRLRSRSSDPSSRKRSARRLDEPAIDCGRHLRVSKTVSSRIIPLAGEASTRLPSSILLACALPTSRCSGACAETRGLTSGASNHAPIFIVATQQDCRAYRSIASSQSQLLYLRSYHSEPLSSLSSTSRFYGGVES